MEVEGTADIESVVYVIDDDTATRDSLKSLLAFVGLRVETFGAAPEFLGKKLPDAAVCLVVDVRLPGVSGLECQAELAKADIDVPIIFITGHGDIAMTVKAMKAGAVDFLEKPFRHQEMLDAVTLAIDAAGSDAKARSVCPICRPASNPSPRVSARSSALSPPG